METDALKFEGGIHKGSWEAMLEADRIEAKAQDGSHEIGAIFFSKRGRNQWVFNRFHDGSSKAVPSVA